MNKITQVKYFFLCLNRQYTVLLGRAFLSRFCIEDEEEGFTHEKRASSIFTIGTRTTTTTTAITIIIGIINIKQQQWFGRMEDDKKKSIFTISVAEKIESLSYGNTHFEFKKKIKIISLKMSNSKFSSTFIIHSTLKSLWSIILVCIRKAEM